MKLRAKVSFLFLISLIFISNQLHLDHTQSSQLQQLKNKQQYLGEQVKNILSNTASVNDQLQNAKNDKERVQILEAALSTQRDQVFDLKNKIIYPFNQSLTACQQLTDKQKIAYLDRIEQTRKQLKTLKDINSKLDQNISKVSKINENIQKQLILLTQMQEIIKTKCKQNLSPTIFQTNLNNKNWILGPQTMNNLQEQYAQRALIFHNITNCPLQTPFYSPSLQTCIKCQEPTPLFNMYSKQCTQCQGDEQLDSDKKICRSRPHYTNFSAVKNWNLEGGSMPQVNKNLTPCSEAKPYYNGIICIPCDLPYYWSISANLCKKCDKGFAFDMNTKNCQKVVKFQLTILQNTKWVSQNLTRIIENRAIELQSNKTTGNYQYCPNIGNPYYDGMTCIWCQYFDIDKSKCIQKPKGTQYNDNMKRFMIPQTTVKQLNSNAKRYITANKVQDNINIPNCNQSYPFYDGTACIQCLKPFDIFNLDTKKCVVCESDEIFVQNTKTCQLRKKIKISSNFNRLLATPKVSVLQYKNSLIKLINDNPEAIIYPCPQINQYSNLTDCFPCQDSEYFNVQTLRCQVCDGIYFDNNQTCKAKVYIFTNLKAGKVVDMDGTTVENQNTKIADFLKTHSDSYVCPLAQPYPIQNKTCSTCPDLFSYSELKCKTCTEFTIFVADTKRCEQAKMVVNFTDAHRILVSQTETLLSFKEKQEAFKKDNPNYWKVCSADKPYTQNRQFCFNCTQQYPYFNYTIKQCQNCPDHYVFDPVTVHCQQQFFITLINSQTQPKMLGYDNYTMQQYRDQQQYFKKSHPFVLCNDSQPFGTATGCRQCNQPTQYFDIKKKDCSDVKYLITFEKISPQYILPTDKNLDSYIAQQQKFRKSSLVLTKKCPDTTPYTNDRNSCFNCSSSNGQHFSFIQKNCERCPDGQAYVKDLKICRKLFYVSHFTPITQVNMKGYSNYTLENYKKDQSEIKSKNPFQQCSDQTPYGTIDGCQQCTQPTPYFDVKKLVCAGAKRLINFLGVNQNYTVAEGKNITSYQQNQKNYQLYSQSLTVECPKQTPYTYDRDYCFVCKQPDYLFNFESKKCQSCPKNSQFLKDKKKCLKQFYVTYSTAQTQKKMVESKDYNLTKFKADEDKIKKQNPYINCTIDQPYGTIDGCRKCIVPQEYFDIKSKMCTAVKMLINFDTINNNYIVKEGKTISDYNKDQDQFEANSDIPTLTCPKQTPYTVTRNQCFNCTSPQILFNFQTKACEKCGTSQVYDQKSRRCIVKQQYTLLTSTTQKNLLQSSNYTVAQYKADQAKIKSTVGSVECPPQRPFAGKDNCISCDQKNPYFNMASKVCQSCQPGSIFVESPHSCLLPAYMTDFTNKNIRQTSDYKIADAKKVEESRAAAPGYTTVKCTGQKPFAKLDGCVACNDTKLPYFNIKTLQCQGCRQFYQYFQNNTCNDNVILTNTKQMIGYIEIDNYTKYNVEKANNFTFLSTAHVVDCPSDTPFYNYENLCVNCNTSSQPIFNLKQKKCVYVESFLRSNPAAMKFYIEQGGQTMVSLKNQIAVLKDRGVNIELCPVDKPYLSHNVCITCPDSTKYFNLGIQDCQACGTGAKCVTV